MDFWKLARDVKSTASAGISFHTFITRSLKRLIWHASVLIFCTTCIHISSTGPHLADYVHETRRIFLSPFVSKASSFFRRVQLSQRYVATGHIRSVDHRRSAWASWNHRVLQLGVSTATVSLTTAWSGARPRFSACRWMSSSSVRTVHCRLYSECVGGVDRAASRVVVRITALVVSVCLCVCVCVVMRNRPGASATVCRCC